MPDFSTILKNLRIEERLSQRELADKLHLSASAIGMYESGQRFPSREIERAIANYFNVSISYLRGEESPIEESSRYTEEFSHYDENLQKRLLSYAKFLMKEKEKENNDD